MTLEIHGTKNSRPTKTGEEVKIPYVCPNRDENNLCLSKRFFLSVNADYKI